eukprot:1137543-Pelagomonas_calceolata.AAC.2
MGQEAPYVGTGIRDKGTPCILEEQQGHGRVSEEQQGHESIAKEQQGHKSISKDHRDMMYQKGAAGT